MKVIIAAGGGHFSPAFAILSNLPKNMEILVVGRKYSLEGESAIALEYEAAGKLGIPFQAITTGRLQRKWTKYTLISLLKLPLGFLQSLLIIKKFKPDVSLVFGGYISLPVVFASFLLGIPIVVHEQTLLPGLTNKIAGFFAKKICVSWESSKKFFPKTKTVLTGNPVKEIGKKSKKPEFLNKVDNLPVLYITGGSLGSHAINNQVEMCLGKLLSKFIVVHQTGDSRKYRDFERLTKTKNNLDHHLKDRYIIKKFVLPHQVGDILAHSDIVVGRSGINTVSELIVFQKPSLLIPLPFSAGREQLRNALFLKDLGLAEVIEQKNLSSQLLYETASTMLSRKDLYRLKDNSIIPLIVNAEKKILEVLNEVVKKS